MFSYYFYLFVIFSFSCYRVCASFSIPDSKMNSSLSLSIYFFSYSVFIFAKTYVRYIVCYMFALVCSQAAAIQVYVCSRYFFLSLFWHWFVVSANYARVCFYIVCVCIWKRIEKISSFEKRIFMFMPFYYFCRAILLDFIGRFWWAENRKIEIKIDQHLFFWQSMRKTYT